MKAYDVMYRKPRTDPNANGKSWFVRVGKAFIKDEVIDLQIDAIPTGPWDGKLVIYLRDEEPR